MTEYTANPTLTIPSNTFTGTFDITGGTPNATTYAYDAAGNQIEQTLGGSSWTQAYNLLGQETQTTDPSGGTSTVEYDADGNLLQTKDAAGNYTSYTYDPHSRKTAEYAAQTGTGNQFPSGRRARTRPPRGCMTTPTAGCRAPWTRSAGDHRIHLRQRLRLQDAAARLQPLRRVPRRGLHLPSGAPGAGLGAALPFTTPTGTTGVARSSTFPSGGACRPRPSPTPPPRPGPARRARRPDRLRPGHHLRQHRPAGSGHPRRRERPGLRHRHLRPAHHRPDRAAGHQRRRHRPRRRHLRVRPGRGPDLGDRRAERVDLAGGDPVLPYTTQDQLSQAWTATDACAATPTGSSHSTVGDGLSSSDAYDETLTYNALGEPRQPRPPGCRRPRLHHHQLTPTAAAAADPDRAHRHHHHRRRHRVDVLRLRRRRRPGPPARPPPAPRP